MTKTPKEFLLNNIDDLDLIFIEGENELEFDIDKYSFSVTYSLEDEEYYNDDDEDISTGKVLKILSINAYDNNDDEDIYVNVDKDIQKLFYDYYIRTTPDEDFEPLKVNFGELSDFL